MRNYPHFMQRKMFVIIGHARVQARGKARFTACTDFTDWALRYTHHPVRLRAAASSGAMSF